MRHALALALLVTACGQDDDGKLAVKLPADHADQVNALVPAEWKDKIRFTVQPVVDKKGRSSETYKLAAPAGWKPGFLGGSLQPADADDFGRSKVLHIKAEMRVGSNCDGQCTNKDWAAVVDKVYYQQFTSGQVQGKVVKDDKRPEGRTLVFAREPKKETQGDTVITHGERGINIITTWWKKGGSMLYLCEADLGEEPGATDTPPFDGLAAAFEKACSLVSVE
jgi:hypothetical protein